MANWYGSDPSKGARTARGWSGREVKVDENGNDIDDVFNKHEESNSNNDALNKELLAAFGEDAKSFMNIKPSINNSKNVKITSVTKPNFNSGVNESENNSDSQTK